MADTCNVNRAPWVFGPRGSDPDTGRKLDWPEFFARYGHCEPERFGWRAPRDTAPEPPRAWRRAVSWLSRRRRKATVIPVPGPEREVVILMRARAWDGRDIIEPVAAEQLPDGWTMEAVKALLSQHQPPTKD